MLLNVFPMSVWPAGNESAEFVYCPLSKKLQPVKAPVQAHDPLAEICATDTEKESFVANAFATGDLRILHSGAAEFEALAIRSMSGGEFDLPKPERNAPGRSRDRSEILSVVGANFVSTRIDAANAAQCPDLAFLPLVVWSIPSAVIQSERKVYSGPELIGVGPRSPPSI